MEVCVTDRPDSGIAIAVAVKSDVPRWNSGLQPGQAAAAGRSDGWEQLWTA